ncbi:RelA/SpoT domain-containing protein [Shewanella sp. CG12_big_fil_rev_8_21_14_0_65_47_15]|uniref:RelA/SpoT domain-containing protein n=1 Tax=Shewanella sp. CG12_big_fil_rev_8_21_14_0_65_47_15 TaxID=1975537 RepID=UPI000CB1F029|nr:RelA/SpoT domain-containing protein [Shewanella sp. CG12_big_fil_rev_8_21_14_0_65_47_15]PIW62061.1 MAG: GTP pyrophosphokinase [Shewanella sp. CG12_big_fil_rev_8_21_14_0_65_47_15]
MNKLFRTFFIFLLLLSTRAAVANPLDINDAEAERGSYSARQAQSHDLHGLYALNTQTFDTPRQSSSCLDNLYSSAQLAQYELGSLLQRIAARSQVQVILPEVKSYQRAAEKVASKFNGDASQITDLARASIVADSISELMQAYYALSEQTQVVKQKNRFAEPKASGYRDLNLLLRLPESGMIAEVQLHLKEIAEIKSGPEHKVYEQVQQIEANALKQQRHLSEFETAQITKLRQESHKLYHKAWLNYKRVADGTLLNSSVA